MDNAFSTSWYWMEWTMKVIGAKYYLSGYEAEEDLITSVSFKSPRDSSGHGSHTAPTAAGRYVTNMNYKGLAAGGAREGAPMARIAVYKTCSATNLAPWMITVAASSTDRDFISDIVLGDGANFNGESLSLFEMNASTSIISASEAYAGYFTPYQSSYCLETSLNNTKARRKILVCQHAESSTDSKLAKSAVVREAGGVGRSMGDRILSYINHTRIFLLFDDGAIPFSRIFYAKTVLGSHPPAPRVAAFSSKGPNALIPEILKPDVMAPGLNFLAA
ncbi:hypothetical protein AAG906_040843 [Vitis piasezkii]